MGKPGADQRLAQRFLGEGDAHRDQVRLELGQGPARQRYALRIGAGARDRHDPEWRLGYLHRFFDRYQLWEMTPQLIDRFRDELREQAET